MTFTDAATVSTVAMADADVALLTLGISVFAAVILIGVGVGVSAMRDGRRRTAIWCASIVGVLTIAGVVIAIVSSI